MNRILRKAYIDAIAPLLPTYYMYLPTSKEHANYCIVSHVSNGDNGTKNSSDVETIIQVAIHTTMQTNNSGQDADNFAESIFNIVYANSQFTLPLPQGFDNIGVELASDITQPYTTIGNFNLVTRILQFKHQIFFNN